MKQVQVLMTGVAFVSVLASAQVAVAGEQGIQNQQRAMHLEVATGSQPMIPAEWRADRYLAMPSMAGAEGQEAQAQANSQPMIPAEWRTDRYLAMPSMAGAEGQEAQARANSQPMIPAEWRDDRFEVVPSMADARDNGIQQPGMSIGSC